MNVGLSETQNGDVSQEAVENVKVKKSPQKSTVLTNGEAAMQSSNSESKKKKKKKRKMVNDAEPGRYLLSLNFSHLVFHRRLLFLFLLLLCAHDMRIPCTHQYVRD